MGDGAQDLLCPRHLDRAPFGAERPKRHAAAVEPANRSTIELLQQIRQIHGDDVDERRVSCRRFLFGIGPAFGHGLLDERDVPFALRGQRARIPGDVGRHLLGHRVVDLLTIARNRMRGADVRSRRHRRDVSGNRDEEPGRGSAASGRRHEYGYRRLRLDDRGVDVTRRVDEAARRPEHDDEEVRLGGVGLRYRAADVRGRDGMDDAVDFRGVDERSAALSGTLTHGAERGRGADGERREQEAEDETRSGNAHGSASSCPDRRVKAQGSGSRLRLDLRNVFEDFA